MVHQGVRDPGGDLLRDGVVPLDVRGAPSGAAAHLEGHHAGGDGRPSDAAGRAAGGDPAEGGIGAVGTVDTVPALIEAECRRRSRILRVEDSEWLLLRQPRVERRGWKRPKEATPQALKDEIASLASQIKTLQREKGRSAPDTLHAIQRMAELRAQLPTAAKVRKAKPATPTPAPAAPPADAEPRRPVETACDTPLFLRSTCTPVSPCLALRSSCACPLTNRLLEDTLVWHKPAAEVSAYALPAAEGSTCPVCLWNVASHLLLASAAPPAATTALVGRCLAADPTPAVRGGALLLRGMAAECGGDGDAAAASYQEAIACDPSIVADYFGLPESGGELADEGNQPGGAKPGPRKFAIFEDFRIGATASSADPKVTAGAVQRGATLRLLHAVAFAKSPLHAHPPDCPAQQMQHDLHCCVRHFLPPHVVRLLSAHYKEMISHGVVTFGDRRTERYFAYNDPVARLLMAQYTAYIGKLVGFDVKPSYSYMISYRDESELLPHQDREQAEIVVSIQLDMFPECDVWPLFIGAEPQPPKRGDAEKPPAELHRKHVLHDGDAVVFRGRRMIHWREKVSPGTQATMLLIHYVAAGYAGPLKTGMNEALQEAPVCTMPGLRICEVSPLECYKVIGTEGGIMEFVNARRPPPEKLQDWSAVYMQFCAAHSLGTVGYRWDQGYDMAQLNQVTLRQLRIIVVDDPMFADGNVTGAEKATMLRRALKDQCNVTLPDSRPLMTALGDLGYCLACLETEQEWELVISPALLERSIQSQDITKQFKPSYGATSHFRDCADSPWQRYDAADEVTRLAQPTPPPCFMSQA